MLYSILRRGVLVAGCVAACLAPGRLARAELAGAPAFPFRVQGVTQVAQLVGTSPPSINDTTSWGVCGGDLGSLMVARDTAYIALGDNYTTCPPGTGGPAPDLAPPDWRSNALGIIANPRDFAHGPHITRWYSQNGHSAAEVIPSQHNAGDCQDTEAPGCEVTAIPTYGFTSQNHLFLAYMSVHHWGAAAQWDVNYSSYAMSSDGGRTWSVERDRVQWGPKSNFAQVAVAPDPNNTHLLFYGIPGGRFGAAKLMRTANNWLSVLSKSSYQYYTGTDAAGRPRWSANAAQATVVASAPVGELSVIYDPGLKQWLMTYLQGGNDQIMPSSDDVVIRSAPHYWGPWSSPVTLASHDQYPGLYGAFMNPAFLADGGRTIYFVMSQWNPYSVFWMRATLAPRP
jgi:hypothetical protein